MKQVAVQLFLYIEPLSSGVWEQQRRRPACASTQSNQRLCYSLIRKYHIWTCYESFECHFVGNPEDRFSGQGPI